MFGSIFKNFKFYLRARKKRKEGRKEREKVEGEKEGGRQQTKAAWCAI